KRNLVLVFQGPDADALTHIGQRPDAWLRRSPRRTRGNRPATGIVIHCRKTARSAAGVRPHLGQVTVGVGLGPNCGCGRMEAILRAIRLAMTERDAFGPTLRRLRLQRGISLDRLATDTKVSVDLWNGLERNDLSRWPTGIYARSYVRAYATHIGVDP